MASVQSPGSAEQPRQWTHLFSRHSVLDDLQQPIKASARIRYNCLSVSQRYIALGTNTGVVYVFSKETLKYGHLITSEKEGAIVQVAFSPDDNILAYATSWGFVFVVRMRLDQRAKPDKLRSTSDHRTATITAMRWNNSGGQVFVGDNMGKVSVINVSNKARDLFKASSEVIMRLESPVIQIDAFDDRVLVSTTTKTYISNTSKHNFHCIGSKSRDGYYGGCFYHSKVNTTPVIYCGRPGSRMWEVDYEEGRVINTHQFKQLLNLVSLPLVDTYADDAMYPDLPTDSPGPQSINFQQLLLINEQFLLTWNNRGVYIFDPTKVTVVLWTNEIRDIHSLQLHQNEVYVLHRDHTLERFDLLAIPKIIAKLFNLSKLRLASQLTLTYTATILLTSARKHVPDSLVLHLINHARRRGRDDMAQQLETVLNCLEVPPASSEKGGLTRQNSTAYERLDSGIYVIRQRSDSAPNVDENIPVTAGGEPVQVSSEPERGTEGGKVGIGLTSTGSEEKASKVETPNVVEFVDQKSSEHSRGPHKVSHGQQIQCYEEPQQDKSPGVLPRPIRVPPGFSPLDKNHQSHTNVIPSHDQHSQSEDSMVPVDPSGQPEGLINDPSETTNDEVAPLTEALGYVPEIKILPNTDHLPTDTRNGSPSTIHTYPHHNSRSPQEHNPAFAVYFKKATDDISPIIRSVSEGEDSSMTNSPHTISVSPEEEKSSQKSSSPSSQSAETDSGIVERCISQESLTASEVSVETMSLHSRRSSSASASSAEIHGAVSPASRSRKKGKKVKSLTVDLDAKQPDSSPRVVTIMKEAGFSENKCVRRRNNSDTASQDAVSVGLNQANSIADGTSVKDGLQNDVKHVNAEVDTQQDQDIVFENEAGFVESGDKSVNDGNSKPVDEPQPVGHSDIDESKSPVSNDITHPGDENESSDILPDSEYNECVETSLEIGHEVQADDDVDSEKKTERSMIQAEAETHEVISPKQEGDGGNFNEMSGKTKPEESHTIASNAPSEENHDENSSSVGLQSDEIKVEAEVEETLHNNRTEEAEKNLSSAGKQRTESTSLDHPDVVSNGLDSSMDSSTEVDKSDDTHSTASTSEDSVSVKNRFFSVRDKLSAKVSATTQSLIQSIKDKKNQLSKKGDGDGQVDDLQEEKVKYPEIDLSDFEAVTVSTRQTLQDYNVMYDPCLTKVTLNSWCVCLHQTLKRLYHEIALLELETAAEGQGQTDTGEGETNCKTETPDETTADNSEDKASEGSKDTNDECKVVIRQASMADSVGSGELDLDLHSYPQDIAAQEAEKNAHLLQTFVANDLELSVEIEDVKQRRDSSIGKMINLKEELEQCQQGIGAKDNVEVHNCDTDRIDQRSPNDDRLKLRKDIMYIDDPFNLSPSLQEDASHLANLAIQFECHGDIDTHFEMVHDSDCDSKSNLTCDHQRQSNRRKDGSYVTHGWLHLGEQIDWTSDDVRSSEDTTSCMECLKDECMALFIRLYFHLLSGKVTSLQKAILSHPSCRQTSWRSLVTCIQASTSGEFVCQLLANEEIDGAFDLLRSNIGPDGALCLGFLQSLYHLVPKKTLKFLALDCWLHISPLEVLWLCDGPNRDGHFEFYVHHCLHRVSGNRRRECIRRLCKYKEVQSAWWELLLNQGTKDKKKKQCHCGMPWPGAHAAHWKQESLMTELLQLGYYDDAVIHVCYQHGYWPGVLHHLHRSNSSADWWPVTLQLGDASLLDKCSDFMPKTQKEWTSVLKLKEKQTYGCQLPEEQPPDSIPQPSVYCLTCGKSLKHPSLNLNPVSEQLVDNKQVPEITWEDLGRHLVSSMGTEVALDLLNSASIPQNALTLQFYDACIKATSMDQKQRALVHLMLEKLDTYLWSNRTASLPPQVALAVSQEHLSHIQQDSPDRPMPDRLFSKLDDLDLSAVTLEDPDVHWGMQANINSLCQSCAIPLAEVMSPINSGIHIFQCGHGYHRSCVPEQTCLVCIGKVYGNQQKDS